MDGDCRERDRLEKGLVQIYMGDGKGKTTAALGLSMRAIGWGFRVRFIQFMKNRQTGELASARRLDPLIRFEQFGTGRFVMGEPTDEDRRKAKEAWEAANEAMSSGEWDIVVLDEVGHAIKTGLIGENEVSEFIKRKPSRIELILTGRSFPQGILELADLVTEMVPRKHPYERGIGARKGIEY